MRTVRDLFDLSGRVALVTGGAGHIGSAIAEALAECGARIGVVDNQGTGVLPETAQWFVCDVTTDIRKIVKWTKQYLGRIDILVNCAAYLDGPGLDVPFAEQTVEDMDRSWAVNLRAPILLVQACAPMLRESGHGSIINIGSIYGMVAPDPSLYAGTNMGCGAAYAATKGGLLQLTRYLASVLAPDIRCNAISPGGVWRGQPFAFHDRYCDRVPLGRMATEEDIKGAAAYLASDASAYVTGQNIVVDGGWTAL